RMAENDGLLPAAELEALGVAVDADDVEGLEESLGAGGAEPERLQLRGDVRLGQGIAPGAGSAALEQVGREEADVGADGIGGDGPLGSGRGLGGRRGGER